MRDEMIKGSEAMRNAKFNREHRERGTAPAAGSTTRGPTENMHEIDKKIQKDACGWKVGGEESALCQTHIACDQEPAASQAFEVD
jgi:hypothetical protein